MRKSTLNLIVGILIGIVINHTSGLISVDSDINTPIATVVSQERKVHNKLDKLDVFERQIAPGLQIIEVPPPLDLNGRLPYQCYFYGQPVKLPNDVVKNLLVDNDHLIEKDDSVNIHNFTGNLKMIDAPVGATLPSSFPQGGRTR